MVSEFLSLSVTRGSSPATAVRAHRHAIVSASSTAKRDSMRPAIGTAGIRYRQTSRVWAPAAVTIEAAHITITISARVKNRADAAQQSPSKI